MKDLKECKVFTTKDQLLEDQRRNPPFGSLKVDISKIIRIHKTSGTTNKPLLIPMTSRDIETTVEIGKKCFELSGVKTTDVVVHCLSYNMWMGGYTDHQSLEATGAAVIPFGVGNTHNLIETILTIKPTAIHCTPSYLSKIEMILEKDYLMKPEDLGIKLGLLGGESGLGDSNFRKKIETKWKIKAMNANYGMADVLSMFGAECYQQNGLHFMGDGVLSPEIIDPETLEFLPIKKNITGELVLTNLKREAIQLIRYRTGDIIRILDTKPCLCGCPGFKFEIIGRYDDMFIINGVNVFANAVQCLINSNTRCSGSMEIHISSINPVEKVLLKVEKTKDFIISNSSLRDDLLFKIKSNLSFSPEIQILEYGQLPRTDQKTRILFKTL